MKFIRDILTENDGQSFCVARVGLMIALSAFILFSGYEVFNSKTFKMVDFGNAIMQILIGGGTLIGAKQYSGKQ